MSEEHDANVASARLGLCSGEGLMRVMTRLVEAMRPDLPQELHGSLARARSRWFDGKAVQPPLETDRIAAWQLLEAKTGSSVVINDRTDVAIRSLICVLWDELAHEEDRGLAEEFFGAMVARYGGLAEVLDEAIAADRQRSR